jgi:hypothetical protein
MRECEGTRLNVYERYVQVQDEFVTGIRVYSEISSSMICMVNATSKNVKFTPQAKYYEHKISHHEFLFCKTSVRL